MGMQGGKKGFDWQQLISLVAFIGLIGTMVLVSTINGVELYKRMKKLDEQQQDINQLGKDIEDLNIRKKKLDLEIEQLRSRQ